MTDYVDTIIADAVAQENASQAASIVENKPQVENADTQDNVQDQDNQEQRQETQEEFSKKARNALSYRDKKIGKLSAEKQQMAQQLQELQAKLAGQQTQQPQNQKPQAGQSVDGKPQPENFESLLDYQEALTEWKVEQRLTQRDKEQQEKSAKAQTEAKYAETVKHYTSRADYAEQKESEYVQAISDFKQVMDENLDVIENLRPDVIRMVLDSDDPALAGYHLAKEGKLTELEDMTPNQAALAIAKAIAKGVPAQNKVTGAPAPMSANKGTSSQKSVESMSYEELKRSL